MLNVFVCQRQHGIQSKFESISNLDDHKMLKTESEENMHYRNENAISCR